MSGEIGEEMYRKLWGMLQWGIMVSIRNRLLKLFITNTSLLIIRKRAIQRTINRKSKSEIESVNKIGIGL
jgi:hypothetical protein